MGAVAQPCRDLMVALKRHGGGKESDRNVFLVEQTLEPPDARPRAVFVNRFHGEVPVLCVQDVWDFAEPTFISTVGRPVDLRTFLKVDDNVDGDARLARPHNLWHVSAIANIVPLGARNLVLRNFYGVLPLLFARDGEQQFARDLTAFDLAVHVADLIHGGGLNNWYFQPFFRQGLQNKIHATLP